MALRLLGNSYWHSRHCTAPKLYSFRSAGYHDYIRFQTAGGTGRTSLVNPRLIGVATSRGNRAYQQDFYGLHTLSLDPLELQHSLQKTIQYDWDPTAVPEDIARQVHFVGIFDGHGGSTVSQFCRQEFHALFENANKNDIPELYAWIKEIGGYFKRFKGGALAPWIVNPDNGTQFDLEARATTTFFEVDRSLSFEAAAKTSGATASIALLQSLDTPALPFFSAEKVALTVAHCGDTCVILCATEQGQVIPMTTKHHADTPVESTRLRRMMGSSLVTDSFGEARWMGTLENTRGLGDLKFKPFGITPEPEVRSKFLEGAEYSHIALLSDGVTSVMSNEEINDLIKYSPSPVKAAQRVLSFAEEMGSEDNATAIVVPLRGWGKCTGVDGSKALREYRSSQMEGTRRM